MEVDWAQVPQDANGRTHGVCITRDHTVIVFAQCRDALLHFDTEGHLKSRHGGDHWLAAHGLAYHTDGEQEFLWLTDEKSGLVAKTTLTGEILQTLPPPVRHPASPERNQDRQDLPAFKPTWAVQNVTTGSIWVADGYGSSLIFQYDRSGKHIDTLSGEDSGTRFNCPHGIHLDEQGNLWIADRGNRRIAIYDAEGSFIEAHHERCHSPCGFDHTDELIVIPELYGSIKLFNRDWQLVDELGKNPDIQVEQSPDGNLNRQMPKDWPNVERSTIPQDSLNSPHGACFGHQSDIYVVEWILGGRISRLSLT